MKGALRTQEVYYFLQENPPARHLFVWTGETKGRTRRTKSLSGRLVRKGTAAGSAAGAEVRLQRGSAGDLGDTLPSQTPLQGQ